MMLVREAMGFLIFGLKPCNARSTMGDGMSAVVP